MGSTQRVWSYTSDGEFDSEDERGAIEAIRAHCEAYWRRRISTERGEATAPLGLYMDALHRLEQLKEVLGEQARGMHRSLNRSRGLRRRIVRLSAANAELHKERREVRKLLRRLRAVGEGPYSVFEGTPEETLAYVKDRISAYYEETKDKTSKWTGPDDIGPGLGD